MANGNLTQRHQWRSLEGLLFIFVCLFLLFLFLNIILVSIFAFITSSSCLPSRSFAYILRLPVQCFLRNCANKQVSASLTVSCAFPCTHFLLFICLFYAILMYQILFYITIYEGKAIFNKGGKRISIRGKEILPTTEHFFLSSMLLEKLTQITKMGKWRITKSCNLAGSLNVRYLYFRPVRAAQYC